MLKEIDEYNGPDPLEPWLRQELSRASIASLRDHTLNSGWPRLVKWTEDTFATGGSKGDLLKVLEECMMRRVTKQEQYKNDPRCLKLWMTYVSAQLGSPRIRRHLTCSTPQANLLPDPHDVFVYLKVNAAALTNTCSGQL